VRNISRDPLEQVLFSAWWLIGLLVLAFALRVYALSVPSAWLDEAHTWYFARLPWADLFNSLRMIGVHPPAYFGLEKLVVQVIGDQEWSLRIASVFVDMLALACFIRLGQLAGGSIGCLVSGCFWAFQPMTIWYANEARPYALAGALACALVMVFLMLQQHQSRKLWLAAGLLMLVGLSVHYFFFLVIGALTLWTLVDLRRASPFLRNWLGCTLLAVIPLVLWLYWMFQQPQVTLGIGWITRPMLSDYPITIWNLFSGYGGVWTSWSILFGVATLVLAGLGVLFDTESHLARRALVFGVLLPLSAVWLISQVRPIYVDRYFIVLLPFVGIMLSCGARALQRLAHAIASGWRSQVVVYGSLLVFVVAGFGAGWSVHTEAGYAREDWRSLAAMLMQQPQPLPEIWLSDPESIVPLRYYYHRDVQILDSTVPPACAVECWYVLRQTYATQHSFGQGGAARPAPPADLPACSAQLHWVSPTGLAVWRVKCG
jgi:hypothetical protein